MFMRQLLWNIFFYFETFHKYSSLSSLFLFQLSIYILCIIKLLLNIFHHHFSVSLKADFKNYIVSVKYLGQNPSALNGCCLNRKTIYHAIHNDILDVVYTKLRYKVIFEPSPPIVKTNGDSNSSLSITDDKVIKV